MKRSRRLLKRINDTLHLTVLQRIFVVLGCMMLAVCILFFSIFNYVYRSNIRGIVADEMQNNLDRINEYINLIITNSASTSSALMNNATLQSIFAQQHLTDIPIHANTEFRAFFTLFKDISSASEFIDSTDLYIQPKQMLLRSDLGATSHLNGASIEYLNEITEMAEDLGISREYSRRISRQFLRNTESIAVIRPLFSGISGKKMGFISINIHARALQRILRTMQGSECVLIDKNNQMVVNLEISGDAAPLFDGDYFRPVLSGEKGVAFQKVDGREYIIATSEIESIGWWLVSFTPTDKLIHKGFSLQTYLLMMNIIMFLFISAAMFLVLRQVTKRIHSLVYMMNRVKGGDFEIDFKDKNPDEFSYLFASFNSMVKNVDFMINEIYHLELMHKDMQLRLLQGQVNPHFLYNIFNNMHWLIKLARYEDLDTLVTAVSVFYSRSLNDGKHMITMRNTIEKLNSYVQIQQIRFRDRFTFTLCIEESLTELEILNHLIQPLLENAIIHGIEPSPGTHQIKVSGHTNAEGRVIIEVSDSGAGIPAAKLREINESLLSEEVQGEFLAIKNVHNRIKMFYGPEYGLSIESTEGAGTSVTITLPYPGTKNKE